jgi:hypothetical protein
MTTTAAVTTSTTHTSPTPRRARAAGLPPGARRMTVTGHTLSLMSAPTTATTLPAWATRPAGVMEPGPSAVGHSDCLVIDCDSCSMIGTTVCADCVVTYLCDRDAADAVIVDVDDVRALHLLADAGLVPSLRHDGAGRHE